jgi:tetratricopeptide (TPR) repeat protein
VVFLLAVVVYLPALRCGFVRYDDQVYVSENPQVQQGLRPGAVAWAMRSNVSANWHPLTMLSHLLDCSLYGLDARGHHLSSIVIHAFNAALLFRLLLSLTGAPWRSAFVAALFAVHPLNVESVVWIAERKNVLSTLFWLLTLIAYRWYCARPSVRRYLVVVAGLQLGLMAKPMLVTLPLTLLLLDFWPLGRLPAAGETAAGAAGARFVEKLPLLSVALAAGMGTLRSQGDAGVLVELETFSLADRLAMAVSNCAEYAFKLFWPRNLAALYLRQGDLPAEVVAGSAAMVVALTVLAFACVRRRYLLFGWLWFLTTLLPVIGLITVGLQSTADRYLYVPELGLFVAATWLAGDVVGRGAARQRVAGALAAAVLVALAAVTVRQIGFWTDSSALFRRAIAVSPDNAVMRGNLAHELMLMGRAADAEVELREAIRLDGRRREHRVNLGNMLLRQRRLDEAEEQIREALKLDPAYALGHYSLGNLLSERGRTTEAIAAYAEAVRLKPGLAGAHLNLGLALLKTGDAARAMNHLEISARLDPRRFAIVLPAVRREAENAGGPDLAREVERRFAQSRAAGGHAAGGTE